MTQTVDLGGNTLIVENIKIGATASGQAGTDLSITELGYLDTVTAGTATASKAVVLGASKDIATITSATITTLTTTTTNATTGNISDVVSPTNLTLNATSTGTIGIGSVSTGAVTITPATTVTGAITPTGGIASAGGFTTRDPKTVRIGNGFPLVSTDGTDSTPVTTETYVSEVHIPNNVSVTGVALFNGSNVTGNVTVGLADSTGAPITAAKSASTAGSGTDAFQLIPFAAPYVAKGPATYYVQVQYDSGTARYNTHTIGTHGVMKQTSQTYGVFASFTPPTTFVTAIGNMGSLY